MVSTLLIAAGVLAIVVLLAAGVWLSRRSRSNVGAPPDRIDTLTGWPPQATRVLTTRERIAFGTLVRALPEYMILAQVPLARFLDVPKRYSYADWLRRLGYQCVDFAVCDMSAQVIAVIELQPVGGSPNERVRKRLARMARSLKAAKIPMLVWPDHPLPSVAAARDAILPVPPVPISSPMPLAPLAPMEEATKSATEERRAAPPASPFDEDNRDSTLDETIELLEPPPSTWFDDIDSGPTPLNKR